MDSISAQARLLSADRARIRNPYPGLEAFAQDQWEVFFGRETERVVIAANLAASRLTVLYGPSGVGKSSLLQAGVAHDLEVEAREAASDPYVRPGVPVIVRDWHSNPRSEFDANLRSRAPRVRPDLDLRRAPTPRRLGEMIAAWSQYLDADILVILDQFEEFFLYGAPHTGLGAELAECLGDRQLRASFLLALREESLADLDAFESKVPGLLDNRLRLPHLTAAAAEDAIRRPVDVLNSKLPPGDAFTLDDGLVEAVIAGASITDSAGRVTGVEAPLVSLVMEDVWQRDIDDHSRRLRISTLEAAGGPATIARSHVDRALQGLPPGHCDVAAAIFDKLLTPTGSKIALNARDLAAWTELPEEAVETVLRALSASEVRILRPKASPHASSRQAATNGSGDDGSSAYVDLVSYEVFHDLLAAGIVNWSSNRRRQVERQLAHEQETMRRARQGDIAVFVASLVVLAMALAGVVITLAARILQNELEIAAPFMSLVVGVGAWAFYRQEPHDRRTRRMSALSVVVSGIALLLALANGEVFGTDAEVRGFTLRQANPNVVARDFTSSVANRPGGGSEVELALPLEVANFDGEPAVTIVSAPTSGTVHERGGSVIYRPDEGFSGTDSFAYEACLGETSACDTGRIAVAVMPYALDDEVQAVGGTTVRVNVLGNDSGPDLIVSLEEAPTEGIADVTEGGVIDYTPPPTFEGADSFSYIACAGDLCATARVTVVASVTAAVPVPDVVGMSGAGAALRVLGFQVVETSRLSTCTKSGEVISQEPTAGTSSAPGTQVSLIVSAGAAFGTAAGCDATPYDEAVVASDPLIYWPLSDSGDLDPLVDVIGGYDLSGQGLRVLPGPQGMGAVSLDASSLQRLDSAFNPAEALAGSWSVEAWILPSADTARRGELMTLVGGYLDQARRRWYVNVREGGKLCVGIGAPGAVCSAREVTDGRWHHVVVTFDATAGFATVYVDGLAVPLESEPWAPGELPIDTNVAVGAIADVGREEWREHWDGGLTRLAVYDRVLQRSEVRHHYGAVAPDFATLSGVLLEAEDAEVNELSTGRDATASGGAYIAATADGEGKAELSFDIEYPGTYVVWARVNTNGYDGSNSFEISMDGDELDVWDVSEQYGAGPLPIGWVWEEISTQCGGNFDHHLCDPRFFELETGRHTIRFVTREPNTRLDKIVIADADLMCPVGLGCPAESAAAD